MTFQKFRKALFQYDPEPLELQSSLMAVASGVWMLLGWLDESVRNSNAFKVLLIHLPAEAWVCFFITLAVFRIYTTFHIRSMFWRGSCAMVSALLWAVISILVFSNEVSGPSKVMYPVFMITEVWIYIRLSVGYSACVALGQHPERPRKVYK